MTNGPSRLRRVPADRPTRTASNHAPTTDEGERECVSECLDLLRQLTGQVAYFSVEKFCDSWVDVARAVVADLHSKRNQNLVLQFTQGFLRVLRHNERINQQLTDVSR